MNVSLKDAHEQLTDLVSRAEAGEDIVLTRDGRPAVRLVAVVSTAVQDARRAVLMEIWEAARARRAAGDFDGEDAARSQDFLYDENGLPG